MPVIVSISSISVESAGTYISAQEAYLSVFLENPKYDFSRIEKNVSFRTTSIARSVADETTLYLCHSEN